jgi:hypothetical protein
LTTSAGVSCVTGSSSTGAFSVAAGFAAADDPFVDFDAVLVAREAVLVVDGSVSSFDELEVFPIVISGCETGDGFVSSGFAAVGGALTGFAVGEGVAGEVTATCCDEELPPPFR